VNAEITGEILHSMVASPPDTEIPASHFRQGGTSPPFPLSASHCETRVPQMILTLGADPA
jgi:hypothetical protein